MPSFSFKFISQVIWPSPLGTYCPRSSLDIEMRVQFLWKVLLEVWESETKKPVKASLLSELVLSVIGAQWCWGPLGDSVEHALASYQQSSHVDFLPITRHESLGEGQLVPSAPRLPPWTRHGVAGACSWEMWGWGCRCHRKVVEGQQWPGTENLLTAPHGKAGGGGRGLPSRWCYFHGDAD